MILKFRTVRTGMEEWHFVEECALWPTADYVEKLDAPAIAELCEKCIELSATRYTATTRRSDL